MPRSDPYHTLGVVPGASDAEITMAYERLAALYSANRYLDGPPEFAEQAAQKRHELAAAYQAIKPGSGPTQVLQAQQVDFRPLPPARRQERPINVPEVVVAAPPRRDLKRKPQPLIGMGVVLGVITLVFLLVSLPGVRTESGVVALTPVAQNVDLPYTPVQLDEFRRAAQKTPSADTWVQLGNALFDNLETLREADPFGAQYQTAARGWPEASNAYQQALKLRDDPETRVDLALTKMYYGVAINDNTQQQAGLAEAQKAYAAAPDQGRVALKYGLVLMALDPPQTTQAVEVWRKIVQQTPKSAEAQQAQQLLATYAPQTGGK